MKALLLILWALPVQAGQVIDVGKFEIQGNMRGPEVQYIDPDRVDAVAAGRLFQQQLKEMETELLRHEAPGEGTRKKP